MVGQTPQGGQPTPATAGGSGQGGAPQPVEHEMVVEENAVQELAEGEEPPFPHTELAKLDEMINRLVDSILIPS